VTPVLSVPGINDALFQPAYFFQLVANGVTNGAIYALMAVAVVIIYRTTGHLNFAQGEMGTVACFLVFTAAVGKGVPYWVAIPGVMLLMMAAGAVIQRGLVQPIARRGGLGVVMVTLGLFLILNALTGIVWGTEMHDTVKPFPSEPADQFILLDGPPQFAIRYGSIGILVTLAVVVALLWALMQRTSLGLSYRAVASNTESAVLAGIPVERMRMFGWALAAAIGSVAAVLSAQKSGALEFTLMSAALLYGLASAALGGFDSLIGAVVGALIIGLAEALLPALFTFIGSELSLVMALVVIVVALVVRPHGLFGTKKVERV
jgi:branched-chain amino acid transport system permease protein